MSMPTLFSIVLRFFFFNDTSTTEIYTLSLHDALPISLSRFDPQVGKQISQRGHHLVRIFRRMYRRNLFRSEEHTSELQSLRHLVCRLLLEKKKNKNSS